MGETRTGDYMFYSVEKCTDKDSDKASTNWTSFFQESTSYSAVAIFQQHQHVILGLVPSTVIF